MVESIYVPMAILRGFLHRTHWLVLLFALALLPGIFTDHQIADGLRSAFFAEEGFFGEQSALPWLIGWQTNKPMITVEETLLRHPTDSLLAHAHRINQPVNNRGGFAYQLQGVLFSPPCRCITMKLPGPNELVIIVSWDAK